MSWKPDTIKSVMRARAKALEAMKTHDPRPRLNTAPRDDDVYAAACGLVPTKRESKPMSDTKVPKGVYYNPENANFYTQDGKGMGSAFWGKWAQRAALFPQSRREMLAKRLAVQVKVQTVETTTRTVELNEGQVNEILGDWAVAHHGFTYPKVTGTTAHDDQYLGVTIQEVNATRQEQEESDPVSPLDDTDKPKRTMPSHRLG
jgi:hypothetical protein